MMPSRWPDGSDPSSIRRYCAAGAVTMAATRMRRPRRGRTPGSDASRGPLADASRWGRSRGWGRLRGCRRSIYGHPATSAAPNRLASAARQVGAVLWLAFRLTRAALNCRWSSGLLPGRPPLAALVSALMQPRARLAVAAAEPGKAVLASTGKKETDCDGRGHPDAAGGARTLPLVCGGGAGARGAGGADARLPRQHPPV